MNDSLTISFPDGSFNNVLISDDPFQDYLQCNCIHICNKYSLIFIYECDGSATDHILDLNYAMSLLCNPGLSCFKVSFAASSLASFLEVAFPDPYCLLLTIIYQLSLT